MSWFRFRLVLACSALALSAACSAVSKQDPSAGGGTSSGGTGDCGCGKIDPDCPGPQSNQCTWCDDSSCTPSCNGIDPGENWHC